MHVIISRKKII